MTQNKKGFTLVELMVVMALIAVLSTLIIGAIRLATNTSRETTNRSNARSVQTALEANYAKYRKYCDTTPATVACNTAGADTSTNGLAFVANALSITLSPANACDADGNGAETNDASGGGGRVHVEAGKYWITPYDAACTAEQPDVNDIKVGY